MVFHKAVNRCLVVFTTILLFFFAGENSQSSASDQNKKKYAVGSLASDFEVTRTGAANFRIKIFAPPGIADLTPLLTINYNSQSGNGILGMGFSLQGLTSIRRYPSNLAQNGFIHGVDFSKEDRFSLNGEQLVAVKGAYGEDNTEYRTYLSSNTKIISYGQTGNGPTSFKVWTKDGQIAEYGFTEDSKINAQGKNTIATWALSKISDRAGNYILIKYKKDEENGSYYPEEINYTGNDAAKISPFNSIKFFYADRPDKNEAYQAGSVVRIAKRLSEIQIFSETELVYTYKFSYKQSLNTLRSLLVSLEQCAKNNVCLPPTNFTWQETQNPHWVEAPNYALPVDIILDGADNGVRFIDLNGDGLLDILYKRDYLGNGAWINNGYTWEKADRFIFPGDGENGFSDKRAGRDKGARFLDFSGNGFSGIILSYHWDLDNVSSKLSKGYKTLQEAWINSNSGWQLSSNYHPPSVITETGESSTNGIDNGVRFVDLNGDGLPDIIQKRDYRSDTDVAWLNTGNGWQWAPQYKFPDGSGITDDKFGRDKGVRFLDLNGDGLIDIIISYTWQDPDFISYQSAYINTGNGWQRSPNFDLPAIISSTGRDTGVRFIDLNGDGLIDAIQGDGAARHAWINTGNCWINAPNFTPPFSIAIDGEDQGIRFIDLNGDGVLDAIQNDGAGHINAWINTGNGWALAPNYKPPELTSYLGKDAGFRNIDLNGSGIDGILRADGNNAPHKAWINSLEKPDLLINIQDGLGSKLNLSYKPLTDKNIYARDYDAKFPNVDIQLPIYVIAKTVTVTASNDLKSSIKNNGLHITKYNYRGAKIHRQGFGFLGFREIVTRDQSTGVSVTKTYSLDIDKHNVGELISTETHLANGNLITKTQNVWSLTKFGDGLNQSYYAPYTQKIITISYDLISNPISQKITEIKVDDFLNPIEVKISSEDKSGIYTTTTKNIYTNNTEKWLIGLLVKSSLTANTSLEKAITRTSSYKYNEDTGVLLETIREPDLTEYSLTTTYVHDLFGNVIKTTISGANFLPRSSSNIYDAKGQFILQKINALGHLTQETFDKRFNKPLMIKDANGCETFFQYDNFGRLVLQKKPDGSTTNLTYDWNTNGPFGAVYSVTSHHTKGPTEKICYDQLNRQIATTTQGSDGRTIWRTTTYDDLGQIIQTSAPYFTGDKFYCTNFFYDPCGRMIKIIHPNGTSTKIEYAGLKITVINALFQKTTKFMNSRGDLLKVTDNLGQSIFYQYDPFSNVTKITDSLGNVTRLEYDLLGRRTAIYDPDKGPWTYQYNALSELISETDALKQTTAFNYDLLGRMIARSDPAGTSTWEYDKSAHGIGKISTINGVTNPEGLTATSNELLRASGDGLMSYKRTYLYDELSRPIKTIVTIGDQNYLSKINYDENSRPELETYPSGLEIKNKYNDLGFLVAILNAKSGQIYWQVNSLDAYSHILSETLNINLKVNYGYDNKNNFLTKITAEKINLPNAITKQNLIYTYDALGNIKARQDLINNISENFAYDGLNRLITANKNYEKPTSWRYDAIGNIIYKSDIGNFFYGEHDGGPHALTSVTGNGRPGQFFYNKNGDQTSASIDGAPRTLHYTTYSKPFAIVTNQGTTKFYYNADRERFARVDKFPNGKDVTTLYLNNFELVTIRDNKNSSVEEKHYIGPSALYIKTNRGNVETNEVYTLLRDSLGSITDILDANANVISHFYYSPFGEQKQIKGDIKTNPYTHHGFTGHEEVEIAALIHMAGRIYDPVYGRFLSADPFVQNPEDLEALNRYSYCRNNPLRYTDPTGYNFFGDIIHDFGSLIDSIGSGLGKLLQNSEFDLLLQLAVGAWMPSMLPVSAMIITKAHDGNFAEILRSAGISFLQIESWDLTKNITGNLTKGGGFSNLVDKMESILIHGAIGGSLNSLSGNNFKDGFISGALTGATSNIVNNIAKDQYSNAAIMGRSVTAGFIGGTIQAFTGGNFGNGASTSAFAEMFSERTALFNATHGQKFSNENSLAKTLEPNNIVFGERALEKMPGHITIIDWYLHLLHLDLAHMEVFYTDGDGVLHHRGFNGGGTGIHADENYRANDLSNYSFGPITKNVNVTESILSPTNYQNPSSYNLFLHNCQYYADAVRQRLHLEYAAF